MNNIRENGKQRKESRTLERMGKKGRDWKKSRKKKESKETNDELVDNGKN